MDLAAQLDRKAGDKPSQNYRKLVEQVCGHDVTLKPRSSLQMLTERIGCNIAHSEWEELFKDLRGRHVHIWRDEDLYTIQISPNIPKVAKALQRLADSESECDVHSQPKVTVSDKSVQFIAKGDNAFLYAKLFLALEAAEA